MQTQSTDRHRAGLMPGRHLKPLVQDLADAIGRQDKALLARAKAELGKAGYRLARASELKAEGEDQPC